MATPSYTSYPSRHRGGGGGIAFPIVFGSLLLLFYCVLWMNQIELSLSLFSGYVGAALCYLATLLEVRVGLTLMLVAIGISPEIGAGSVSDLRIEDIIVPATFFAWVTRLIINRETLFPTPLKGPIFGYLTIGLLATLNGVSSFQTEVNRAILFYLKTIEYFLIFLMVLNNVRTYDQARFFIMMMVVSACLTGLYGIFISRGLTEESRLAGPPGEGANIIGGYFSFHIVLLSGLATTARRSLRRLLIILAVILLGFPMLRTASRASIVSLMVGLAALAYLSRGRIIWGIMGIFTILPFFMPQLVLERFLSIFALLPGSDQVIPSSFTAKVSSWQDNFHRHVLEKPILGWGMGHFTLAHVDNEFVKVAMEVGLVGLLFFLGFILRMIQTSKNTYHATHDPLYKGFNLGYFGGVWCLAVHSWGSASMTTIRTMEPLMFATGIMSAIHYMEVIRPEKEERHEQTQKPHDRSLVARRRYHS